MPTPVQFAALCFGLLACAVAGRAQQMPALPPTIAAPVGDADFVKTPEPLHHRARVQYSSGKLLISADNSSLNEILVAISEQTGMKTTGGVADQQVFGTYGPGDAGVVLVHLLRGSGSNVLVREDKSHKPRELVLLPSTGGATPPSPGDSAQTQDRSEDRPPEPQARPEEEQVFPSPSPAGIQPGIGLPATAPTGTDGTPADGSDSGTTQDQSPNGVKTPQQIYDQLRQMQNRTAPQQP